MEIEQSQESPNSTSGTVRVDFKEYIDNQIDRSWRKWIWGGIIIVQAVFVAIQSFFSIQLYSSYYEILPKLAHIEKVESQLSDIEAQINEKEENSRFAGTRGFDCGGEISYFQHLDMILSQEGFSLPSMEDSDSISALINSLVVCEFSAHKFAFEVAKGDLSGLRRVGIAHNGLPPNIQERLRGVFLRYFKNANVRFFDEPRLPKNNYYFFISKVPKP